MDQSKVYPPSFKIYSSQAGDKATEFRVTNYIKDNINKGWRLAVEFTLDKWKTKKSILLQDNELVELYLVITGKKQEMKAQRKDPVKSFTCKFQGAHSYVEFSEVTSQEKYRAKIMPINALQLTSMIVKILQFDMHVKNQFQESYFLDTQTIITLLNQIACYGDDLTGVQNITSSNQNTHSPANNTASQGVKPQQYEDTPEGLFCTSCGKAMDLIKEAKIIDFSKKKHGRTICMTCQKG